MSCDSGPAARAAGFALLLVSVAIAATWQETTTEDFRDGTFSDNSYASSRGGGAVEFVWRLDLNNDGYIDLVCPDDTIGFLRVYFGSATGYDPSASRLYTTQGGGGADIADLDCDGRADLVHSGWHEGHVTVYWGTDSGPSESDTIQLALADKSEGATVADMDRDGWLDIVCGVRTSLVQVFWGSSTGYTSSNRTDVTAIGKLGHNLDIADLDHDGRLDIAAAAWDRRENPVIYWGLGRTAREVKYVPVSELNPHGVATADLNRDGWLDLVFPGYDTVAPTYVYYGSDSGFVVSGREQILPGLCYGGVSAAYWDADSALDLVFFRGDFPQGPQQPVVVYFNDLGRTPHFEDGDTAEIGSPGFNSSGGMVADLNRDGATDLFVDVYTDSVPSIVFWGPDYSTQDSLPVERCHHGQAREPGNVYDRTFRESYVSSVIGTGEPSLWHVISWDDSTPGGSGVAVAVRAGDPPGPDSTWSGWLALGNGDSIPDSLDSRYIQYRVEFSFTDPTALPLLTELRIDFDFLPYHDVGPITLMAPNGVMDSGMVVTPRARVRNFGNRAEVFPVTMQVGTGYSQTIVETLAVGQIDTVVFPDWIAGPVDTLQSVCFTALPGDTNPANDTVRATVYVLRPPRPDVGAVRILAPLGAVDSGSVNYPRAIVTNFGQLAAVFPVVFTFGDTYNGYMFDSLAPGQSDTLTFPGWSAIRPGLLQMTCYTAHIDDGNRHNDTVRDTLRVRHQPPSDVGAVAILVPTPFADSGMSYVPRAVVRNYGPYRTAFPVRMDIGEDYGVGVIDTLPAGGCDTVTFQPWVASPMGVLPVRCYTMLDGDPNRHNDSVLTTVTVGPPSIHDVATDAILEPTGPLAAGETIVPWVRVVNLGRRAERYFDVRMRIGARYDRRLNVNLLLEPEATLELSFPPWVAELGQHVVTCSTMLVGDMEPANDKKELQIGVARRIILRIDPDTAAVVGAGETHDFRLFARLTGDTSGLVGLVAPAAPPGWHIELRDVAGARLDSLLGVLRPGDSVPFDVHVVTPPPSLGGVRDSLGVETFVVRGFIRESPWLTDSALLVLTFAPALQVHNFPNPLRDRTRFIIGLPEAGQVTLVIYNRAGEVVRTLLERAEAGAGVSLVDWDALSDGGRPVASGGYRYVLGFEHGGVTDRIVKKLAVIRR